MRGYDFHFASFHAQEPVGNSINCQDSRHRHFMSGPMHGICSVQRVRCHPYAGIRINRYKRPCRRRCHRSLQRHRCQSGYHCNSPNCHLSLHPCHLFGTREYILPAGTVRLTAPFFTGTVVTYVSPPGAMENISAFLTPFQEGGSCQIRFVKPFSEYAISSLPFTHTGAISISLPERITRPSSVRVMVLASATRLPEYTTFLFSES